MPLLGGAAKTRAPDRRRDAAPGRTCPARLEAQAEHVGGFVEARVADPATDGRPGAARWMILDAVRACELSVAQ